MLVKMKISSALIFVAFFLATSDILAAPAPASEDDHVVVPAPGTQPGCGPKGCHNPTGTFGLKYNDRVYHQICDQHSSTAKADHRPRACFNTELPLSVHLSAPSPRQLHGFIDGSGTQLALFAGEIVTLAEYLEIHVDEAQNKRDAERGCARVRIYELPPWKLQIDETWCPGRNEPIML